MDGPGPFVIENELSSQTDGPDTATLAVSLMSMELLWEDVCSGCDCASVILSFATGVTEL